MGISHLLSGFSLFTRSSAGTERGCARAAHPFHRVSRRGSRAVPTSLKNLPHCAITARFLIANPVMQGSRQ